LKLDLVVLGAAALMLVSSQAVADEPNPSAPPPVAPPAPPLAPATAAPVAPAPSAPAPVAPNPGAAAPSSPPVAPQAAPGRPPGDAAAPAPPGEDLEMHFTATRPLDMETLAERSSLETRVAGAKVRYSLNFFGDFYANVVGGKEQTTKSSFGVGSFSFLFLAELGKGFKAPAEPAIEFSEDNTPGIDLERMHLRYTTNGFWVEAGRSHVDLGYWNVAYHHGKWLQPTIDRPRIVRFEDDSGLLPIHWVGVQVGYTLPISSQMSLTTSASVGNGRGAVVDDVQSGVDKRPEKQGYGKMELKGLGHRDLRIGVSGVYGHISSQDATVRPALPDTALTETIGNAYIAFPSDPVFAVAEAYTISHGGPTRSWETYAAFVVLGYSIPPVMPYVKLERIVMTNGLDPFFVPDPTKGVPPSLDVYEGTLGARIDVSTWSAVKVEYRLSRLLTDQWITGHEGIAAWQFGI